jgi:cytochrome oxidase assembly protein ShyY1
MKPTFWQVAGKPKWLAGLALAIVVAIVFSLFGNWQLSRSIRVIEGDLPGKAATPLEEVAELGKPFLEVQADRLVSAGVFVSNSNCAVVEGRQQLLEDGSTKPGYWVVFDSVNADQVHILIAAAFYEAKDAALAACRKGPSLDFDTATALVGRYEPSEAPSMRLSQASPLFASLSVEQLINFWPLEKPKVYPGFVVSEKALYGAKDTTAESIVIGVRQTQTELNWLSAFYAAEWIIFSGFALFLWGRLVQDERKRIEGEAELSKA